MKTNEDAVNHSPFNTVFETSLRVLMVLDANDGQALTIDMITLLDFICTYGQAFGLSHANLHGDDGFSFCEITARRDMVGNAIKNLLVKELAHISLENNGLRYEVSCKGKTLCTALENENEYAAEYCALALATRKRLNRRSETEIWTLIYTQAKDTLKIGGENG